MSQLPPHRHGAGPPAERDTRRTLRRFALAAALLVVAGFGAGTLFGRVDPGRAARLVVSEWTVTEDGPAGAPGPDPAFPVTGPQRGEPICGRVEAPLDAATQIRTLAAGVVLVQHRVDLSDAERAVVDDLADRDRVAVAPSDDLDDGGPAVVATSWRHRMPLDRVDRELLDAFVTGHVDRAPAVTGCP